MVRITTTDALAFEPASVVVRAGETIRFVISNPGTVIHDFTIGDAALQARRAEEMTTYFNSPGRPDIAGRPYAVLAEPGQTSQLDFTFGSPGELMIGCHVPGHWDARMRGTIEIGP